MKKFDFFKKTGSKRALVLGIALVCLIAAVAVFGIIFHNEWLLVVGFVSMLLVYILHISLDAGNEKIMAEENRELNYILEGSKKQIQSFILVDVPTGKFKILFSSETTNISFYDDPATDNDYNKFLPMLLHQVKKEEEREMLAENLKLSNIVEAISKQQDRTIYYIVNYNSDNEERWNRVTISDVERDSEGNIIKLLFTNVDITHIVAKEYAYQQNIQQSLVEAERASKAKSEFLANMSHEIRTPLNSIIGFNSLIAQEDVSPIVRDYTEDINNSSEILLSLITDILDLSKIEAGKMELVEDEYSISTIIDDCMKMTGTRLNGKDIELKTEIGSMPSVLYGDGLRIRQIMINLLSNAAKYTEKGEIILRVHTESAGRGKVGLVIAVKDTGLGISRENQQKLFKSFQRVEEEKNHAIEGTGLGLSLVKSLLDLMGGTIKVDSRVGIGSTFTVFVPQRVVEEPVGMEVTETEVEISNDELLAFRAPDARVLSVDDILLNRKLIEKMLEKSEAQVDSAKGGIEALELLKQNEYDVVYVDHMMPDMDGVEMLKRFRKEHHEINKNTPFIILTANAVKGAKEEYMGYGFDGYLAKPTSQIELFKTLKQAYERKRSVEKETGK